MLLADAAGGFLPAVIHPFAGGVYLVRDPADLDGDGNLTSVDQCRDDIGESPGEGAVWCSATAREDSARRCRRRTASCPSRGWST